MNWREAVASAGLRQQAGSDDTLCGGALVAAHELAGPGERAPACALPIRQLIALDISGRPEVRQKLAGGSPERLAHRQLGHAALQDAARFTVRVGRDSLGLQRDQPVGHAIGHLEFGVERVHRLQVLSDELEGALLLEMNARRDQHVREDQISEGRAVTQAEQHDSIGSRQRVHVIAVFYGLKARAERRAQRVHRKRGEHQQRDVDQVQAASGHPLR